jgi:hypothetical protein
MEQLMSVDLRVENVTFDPSSGVFAPSTCARHLYLLSKDEHEQRLPPGLLGQGGVDVKTGAEAYLTLLLFACGLRSDKKGECHVTSQLREAWKTFSKTQPKEAVRLEGLMNHVFEDMKLVRAELVGKVMDISTELAARSAAKISGGETVLVIGDAPGITESVIRALGRQKKRHVGTIVITHPDASLSHSLFESARAAQKAAQIQPNVKIIEVPFSAALREMSTGRAKDDARPSAAHVFCCAPLLEEETDLAIADAWDARQESGMPGVLVTLKGKPLDRNRTPDFWNELELKNWVPAEALSLRVGVVKERNTALIAAAHAACSMCVDARMQRVPRKALIEGVKTLDVPRE